MAVDMQILGIKGVSLIVPNIPYEDTPQKVLHGAKKRYASQGAERVTLVPKRSGQGWVKKTDSD